MRERMMTDWRDSAVCVGVGTEMFIPNTPEDYRGGIFGEMKIAKRICLSCTVREECLNFALDNDIEYGVYGGLGPRERRDIITAQHKNGERERKNGHGSGYKESAK